MIMTLREMIDKIIEVGGSMNDFVFITNINDKKLDFFPINFEIIDDEIHIIIDC